MILLELTRGAGSTEGAFAPTASLGKAGSSWPPQFPKGTTHGHCGRTVKYASNAPMNRQTEHLSEFENICSKWRICSKYSNIWEYFKNLRFCDPLEFTTPTDNAQKRAQKLVPKNNSAQMPKFSQKVVILWIFFSRAVWSRYCSQKLLKMVQKGDSDKVQNMHARERRNDGTFGANKCTDWTPTSWLQG